MLFFFSPVSYLKLHFLLVFLPVRPFMSSWLIRLKGGETSGCRGDFQTTFLAAKAGLAAAQMRCRLAPPTLIVAGKTLVMRESKSSTARKLELVGNEKKKRKKKQEEGTFQRRKRHKKRRRVAAEEDRNSVKKSKKEKR